MKSNWIKYVFIIFIILILGFSIYKIKQDEHQEQEGSTSNKQQEIIKELLIKHWDLRPSDANLYIQKALE